MTNLLDNYRSTPRSLAIIQLCSVHSAEASSGYLLCDLEVILQHGKVTVTVQVVTQCSWISDALQWRDVTQSKRSMSSVRFEQQEGAVNMRRIDGLALPQKKLHGSCVMNEVQNTAHTIFIHCIALR